MGGRDSYGWSTADFVPIVGVLGNSYSVHFCKSHFDGHGSSFPETGLVGVLRWKVSALRWHWRCRLHAHWFVRRILWHQNFRVFSSSVGGRHWRQAGLTWSHGGFKLFGKHQLCLCGTDVLV